MTLWSRTGVSRGGEEILTQASAYVRMWHLYETSFAASPRPSQDGYFPLNEYLRPVVTI
jgi:hypothetical protein